MRVPTGSRRRLVPALWALLNIAVVWPGCGRAPDPRRTGFQLQHDGVTAQYDRDTGRLRRLELDTDRDGRPDAWSHMNGAQVERIDLDRDGDGAADRWEYYNEAGVVTKVGLSRDGDGVPDTWAYQNAHGLVARIEQSTKGNGAIDRVEHYDREQLSRIVTDTDGNGHWDTWEIFAPPKGPNEAAVLRAVEIDLERAGRPTHRLVYRPDGTFERAEPVLR